MDSIRDIIPQVIEHLALKKPSDKQNIHELWRSAAGNQAAYSMVKDFQKGMLWVHVDSSARMFELSTRKHELIKNLKCNLPDIKDIVFKIGKVK